MSSGIKVFAPASVGNAIVGFDIMGVALEKPGDEIIARRTNTSGVIIKTITGDKGKLSKDPLQNCAGTSAIAVIEAAIEAGIIGKDFGIEIELHKKMGIGSGLGSSSASAVAGAMAANELLPERFEKRDLLPFALRGEQLVSGGIFADNIAPSLIGGIVFVKDALKSQVYRMPVPNGLYITVVHPHIEILTKEARAILSDTVSLKAHVQSTANIAGFITGLFQSDYKLIGDSLSDVVIEPQRASLIPGFYQAKEAALDAGALGCSISGAGPSIVSFSANSLVAETVANRIQKVFTDLKIASDIIVSKVNQEGAVKC